jgi:hypothetical protein
MPRRTPEPGDKPLLLEHRLDGSDKHGIIVVAIPMVSPPMRHTPHRHRRLGFECATAKSFGVSRHQSPFE